MHTLHLARQGRCGGVRVKGWNRQARLHCCLSPLPDSLCFTNREREIKSTQAVILTKPLQLRLPARQTKMKDAPTHVFVRWWIFSGNPYPPPPRSTRDIRPPARVHQATASPRAPATAASLSFHQRPPSRYLIPPPPANGFGPPVPPRFSVVPFRDRSPAPIPSEHNQCAPWPGPEAS